MAIDYALPAADVATLASIHCRVSGAGEPVVQSLPAMLPNVHLRLRGRATYHFADGSAVEAPRVALVTTAGAFRMELSEDFAMVGLGLLPLGWQMLVGAHAAEFGDTVVDAAALWGPRVDCIWHAAGERFARPDWSAPLDRLLADLPRRRTDAARIAAVDHWLEGTALSVDALAALLDLSHRQATRVTLETVGFNPKALAVRYRALRAASALAVSGPAAMAAVLESYADQSHLIRDFRRTVGWTPAAFCRAPHALAAASMAGRWRAGARRPLILWS